MKEIEQEMQHHIKQGTDYAGMAKKGVEVGLGRFVKAAGVFIPDYITEYYPGVGYIVIKQPSPWDRLRGGSRRVPKIVRIVKH